MHSDSSNHCFTSKHASASRGFTLIELLIVIAIIGLITVVMLFQYRQFDSQLLLRNVAYEIAMTIREAQTLGISVRGLEGDFTASYGVYLRPGASYYLFRDGDNNGAYSSSDPDDVLLNTFTIGRGSTISDICVNGTCGRSTLHVVFQRPDPDAKLRTTGIANGSDATIWVRSPSGLTRSVNITATGQVSVQ